jgi:hypothetical protein
MMELLAHPLSLVLLGAAVNGLVTWGVVKAKLDHLAHGVSEAKESAHQAHQRIDQVILRGS